jgi:hypothetical protein
MTADSVGSEDNTRKEALVAMLVDCDGSRMSEVMREALEDLSTC